jgi:hypothetical protein
MTFGQRVTRVLRLDAAAFEEIEADRDANGQALAVVVVASLAAGLGAGFLLGPFGLIRETLAALIGWVMWAAVTYVIGTKILPEPQTRSDMGELLRVIGFSYAPNVFAIFAYIPILGWLIRIVIAFWLLGTTVIAVRQALDYRSTGRALVVVLIGWVFFVFITAIFLRSG